MESARYDQTELTCPHCGATYRDGYTVCPNCGKPLSPTGYSQYAGDEPLASGLPREDEIFLREASATPADEPLDSSLIEAAPTSLTPAPVSPVALPLAAETDSAAMNVVLHDSFSRETTREDSDWQPDVQANKVAKGCVLYIAGALVMLVLLFLGTNQFRISFIYSSAPAARPTMTAIPVARQLKSAYTMYMAVVNYAGSLTILNINMYNLSSTPTIFPPDGMLTDSTAQVSLTAVEFITTSTASAAYKPNDLDYQPGTVLLPVTDGKVHADRFIIILNPVAAQHDFPRSNYVVAGQVILGFEDLSKLRSGGRVKQSGIIPAGVKPSPTPR